MRLCPYTLFVSLLVLAVACTQQPTGQSGEVAHSWPPQRYRGDVTTSVVFTSNVAETCRKAGLKQIDDTQVRACAVMGKDHQYIVLRNPCLATGQPSRDACHEIGHLNGWPIDHGP